MNFLSPCSFKSFRKNLGNTAQEHFTSFTAFTLLFIQTIYKEISLGNYSAGFWAISHLGTIVEKRFPQECKTVKELSEKDGIFYKCDLLASIIIILEFTPIWCSMKV